MNSKEKKTEEKMAKIKPVYSKRLEELIEEQGIKKNELAKKVFTTPQTISKACQGIRLTRPVAESIIKEYPQYNIGWLLGYSNLKYKADVDKAILIEAKKHIESRQHEESFFDTVARLAEDVGFNAYFDGNLMTIEPSVELEKQGYKQVILSFRNHKLLELQDDISAFMAYYFGRIIKKGNKEDGINTIENN